MNGDVDRRRVVAGDVPDACSAPARRPPGPERARSEAILAASLEVAERGEQVRSQVRGAIVEALTELLVRRRPGAVPRPAPPFAASGGSCSTASGRRSIRTT